MENKKQSRTFKDELKAYSFIDNMAMCQMSGRNLWLLDTGIFYWDYPQFDHIKPWSRGGSSDSYFNIACLSSRTNYDLSDVKSKEYNYFNGFPSRLNLFFNQGVISDKTKNQILRFCSLKESDFYFNQALCCIMWALSYREDPYRTNGKKMDRDDKYYVKAALKKLDKWREIAKELKVTSFEERGLVPENIEKDQELLLSFRDVKTQKKAFEILDELTPMYHHNQVMLLGEFLKNYSFIIYDNLALYLIHSGINMDNVSKSIDEVFEKTYELLEDPLTIPRLKKTILDDIEFLKIAADKILKNRFVKCEEKVDQKTKIYITSYDVLKNYGKEDSDIYFNLAEDIKHLGKNKDNIEFKDFINNLYTKSLKISDPTDKNDVNKILYGLDNFANRLDEQLDCRIFFVDNIDIKDKNTCLYKIKEIIEKRYKLKVDVLEE